MEKKYKYVLTSQFQTDCLELRFSKYRQMTGGRFWFARNTVSESILLKASINIWNEDISPDAHDDCMWSEC